MKCPHCGKEGNDRVIRTIKCADGIIRYRLCSECGQSSRSTETFDEFELSTGESTKKEAN